MTLHLTFLLPHYSQTGEHQQLTQWHFAKGLLMDSCSVSILDVSSCFKYTKGLCKHRIGVTLGIKAV